MFHHMFVHNTFSAILVAESAHLCENCCPLYIIVFILFLIYVYFPFLEQVRFGVVPDRSEYLVCTRCIFNKT